MNKIRVSGVEFNREIKRVLSQSRRTFQDSQNYK